MGFPFRAGGHDLDGIDLRQNGLGGVSFHISEIDSSTFPYYAVALFHAREQDFADGRRWRGYSIYSGLGGMQ